MAEDYKVLIGAELSKDDFAKAEGKIQAFTNKARPPIEIGVKLSDNAQNVIDNLKRNLNELNRDGININGSIGINSSDVGRITKSFESLRVTLDGIHKSLGSLDDSTDAKSILTTINRIGNAFDGLQRDIESLASSLKSLDGLKLNLDLGSLLGTNSKNSMANNLLYGSKAKRFVIPKLQEYIQQIKNEFENAGIGDNLFESSFKRIVDSDGGIRLVRNDLTDEMRKELGKVRPIYEEAMSYMRNFNSLSAVDKMTGLENYIKALRGIADIRGVDLSGISSDLDSISKSITDTINIAAGVVDTDEASKKLSKIFGGIDADGMKSALEPLKQSIDGIIGKLSELEGSFSQSLGSGMNVSGLNETLTNINTTLIKIDNVLDGLGGQVQLQELSKSFFDLAVAIRQATNACTGIESAMAGGSQAFSQMNNVVIQTQSHAQSLAETMRAFGIDQSKIDEATQKLRDLNITVTDVVETLRTGKNLDFKIKGIDQYGRDVTASLAYRMKKRKGKGLQPEMSLTTSIHEKVGNVVKPIDEVEEAYKKMVDLRKWMTKAQKDQFGKDPVFDKEILEKAQRDYTQASNDYFNLQAQYRTRLTKSQNSELLKAWKQGNDEINNLRNKELGDQRRFEAKQSSDQIDNQQKVKEKTINDAYLKMVDARKRMSKMSNLMIGFDSTTNTEELRDAARQYNEASKEYNDLTKQFYNQLSDKQRDSLKKIARDSINADNLKTSHQMDLDRDREEKANRKADILAEKERSQALKNQIKESDNAAKDLISTLQKMNSLRLEIKGLDNEKNANKIQTLNDKLLVEQQRFAEQWDRYSDIITDSHRDQLKNISQAYKDRLDIMSSIHKDRDERNEIDQAFDKMSEIRDRINSLNKEMIGLDPKEYKNYIDEITRQRSRAYREYEKLSSTYYEQLSKDQKEELSNIDKTANEKRRRLESKEKDLENRKQDIELSKLAQEEEIKRYKLEERLQKLRIQQKKLEVAGGHETEVGQLKGQISDIQKEISNQTAEADPDKLVSIVKEADSKIALIEARAKDIEHKVAAKSVAGFNEKVSKESDRVEASFKKIKNATVETQKAYNNYNDAIKAMDNASKSGTDQEKINALDKYKSALIEVEKQIRSNITAEKDTNAIKKLDIDKRAFESGMDVWLKRNSEAADHFADEISHIRQRLKECDATELSKLRVEFTDLKRRAELAGKTVKSFGDRLSDQFKRFGTYFALDNIIDEAVQGIRNMYDQVVQIDTAMTDLYKVTDETPERYEQFLGSAQKGAKELGRSVSSYITQSAKWAQMGYGIGDSEQLAKISSIYSNVADVDDATAVSDIISNLKAFNIDASDAITVVDSLNKLSNEFAVTAAGLGQGLTNSASAMAMSNATFEQTIALLTGITEITQSPSEAGSFLKVASMRIRGLRTFKPITYENMYLLSSINNKVA